MRGNQAGWRWGYSSRKGSERFRARRTVKYWEFTLRYNENLDRAIRTLVINGSHQQPRYRDAGWIWTRTRASHTQIQIVDYFSKYIYIILLYIYSKKNFANGRETYIKSWQSTSPNYTWKNLKYKIHNIRFRFFHRLLPQWLPSNVETKVQSLCQIRWPTPKH